MPRAAETAKFTGAAGLLAYAAAYVWRAVTVEMKHYNPAEFGVWWPLMDEKLLAKLERFREAWGGPVIINQPNTGGLGRVGAKHEASQHYVGPTRKRAIRKVGAADITPLVHDGKGGRAIETPDELKRAYEAAYQAGFTGIGLYPPAAGWAKPGLHVDVRGNRKPFEPAVWGRINRAKVRRALGLDPKGDPYVARSFALAPEAWRA